MAKTDQRILDLGAAVRGHFTPDEAEIFTEKPVGEQAKLVEWLKSTRDPEVIEAAAFIADYINTKNPNDAKGFNNKALDQKELAVDRLLDTTEPDILEAIQDISILMTKEQAQDFNSWEEAVQEEAVAKMLVKHSANKQAMLKKVTKDIKDNHADDFVALTEQEKAAAIKSMLEYGSDRQKALRKISDKMNDANVGSVNSASSAVFNAQLSKFFKKISSDEGWLGKFTESKAGTWTALGVGFALSTTLSLGIPHLFGGDKKDADKDKIPVVETIAPDRTEFALTPADTLSKEETNDFNSIRLKWGTTVDGTEEPILIIPTYVYDRIDTEGLNIILDWAEGDKDIIIEDNEKIRTAAANQDWYTRSVVKIPISQVPALRNERYSLSGGDAVFDDMKENYSTDEFLSYELQITGDGSEMHFFVDEGVNGKPDSERDLRPVIRIDLNTPLPDAIPAVEPRAPGE